MPDPWSEDWEKVDQIGRGGQVNTRLVRARDGTDRLGALQTLRDEKKRNLQARSRMKCGVTALETLGAQHLRVPTVLDGNLDKYADLTVPLYVVMDFIDGETLGKFVEQRGPLTATAACQLVLDLCKTIVVAHESGILHRDLKPDNIILRNTSITDPIIVDFGLAFNEGDEQSGTITQVNEQIRSAFLTLPEFCVAGSNKHDPRADVTHLVGLLFFCITASYPEMLADESHRPPHRRPGCDLSTKIENESLRKLIARVFDSGFQYSVEHRFQSCNQLMERLSLILQPGSDSIESPTQVVESLRDRLSREDQKTFEAQLKEEMAPVLKSNVDRFIQALRPSYGDDIALRSVGSLTFEHGVNLDILKTEGLISSIGSLEVRIKAHRICRVLVLQLCCVGRDCFVRHITLAGGPQVGLRQHSRWSNLLPFSHSTPPSYDEIEAALKPIVADLTHQLEQEVFPE